MIIDYSRKWGPLLRQEENSTDFEEKMKQAQQEFTEVVEKIAL